MRSEKDEHRQIDHLGEPEGTAREGLKVSIEEERTSIPIEVQEQRVRQNVNELVTILS